jgi:hypothetical protein
LIHAANNLNVEDQQVLLEAVQQMISGGAK